MLNSILARFPQDVIKILADRAQIIRIYMKTKILSWLLLPSVIFCNVYYKII